MKLLKTRILALIPNDELRGQPGGRMNRVLKKLASFPNLNNQVCMRKDKYDKFT